MTIDKYQQHQLQHKNLPGDIQFFEKHGQQITYKINNDDIAADTCNVFHPLICQQGREQKLLRLHKDGETFSLNKISTDPATTSVQLAADCFRMGKTMKQFRRFCTPQSPVSLSPSESSTGSYSSISVIEKNGTEEIGPSSQAELVVHEDCDIDEDEDGYICEINAINYYHL